jgi:hypothetical protein
MISQQRLPPPVGAGGKRVKDDSGAFTAAELNRVAKLTPGAVQLPVLPGRLVEDDQVKTTKVQRLSAISR